MSCDRFIKFSNGAKLINTMKGGGGGGDMRASFLSITISRILVLENRQ